MTTARLHNCHRDGGNGPACEAQTLQEPNSLAISASQVPPRGLTRGKRRLLMGFDCLSQNPQVSRMILEIGSRPAGLEPAAPLRRPVLNPIELRAPAPLCPKMARWRASVVSERARVFVSFGPFFHGWRSVRSPRYREPPPDSTPLTHRTLMGCVTWQSRPLEIA